MSESPEIQNLINKYYATLGMITYCKGTDTNPNKYIKEARNMLDELRRLNYGLIYVLEKHLQEKIR